MGKAFEEFRAAATTGRIDDPPPVAAKNDELPPMPADYAAPVDIRDRETQARQELALLAEPAATTPGQILTSDARDGDKIRAAMAILYRRASDLTRLKT